MLGAAEAGLFPYLAPGRENRGMVADPASAAAPPREPRAQLRAELRRRCTPDAPDELLLADMTADAADVLTAVHVAQQRLSSMLLPEVLADGRRAQVVLSALKASIDIGNALARRIESSLQVGLSLKRAKLEGVGR